MNTTLAEDLARLEQLPHHHPEWLAPLLRRWHALPPPPMAEGEDERALLAGAKAWLLVPFTLWPIDLHRLCEVALQRVEQGQAFEPELRALLRNLPPLPEPAVQEVAIAHERAVRNGQYGDLLKQPEKYAAVEEEMLANTALHTAWAEFKQVWPVAEYQNDGGLLRRSVVAERGFRVGWTLEWEKPGSRFQAAFDLFCARWGLYGMRGDTPLLQKITANLTPHGTLLFIPAWFSFDGRRELDWAAITRLHRPRARRRQGAKLTRGQAERRKEAAAAWRWNEAALAQGLEGAEREAWVYGKLGLPVQDGRKLRDLLAAARAQQAPPEQ